MNKKKDSLIGKSGIVLKKDGINIVPTMDDVITTDSAWCGTFQLVWNDMKNEVVKKDIAFSKKNKMVDNLNKESFNTDMISDDYYYKVFGLKTLDLKEKLKNGIREKFNQDSHIIDSFGWGPQDLDDGDEKDKKYLFYAMLYRKFEYLNEFDVLHNGKFRDTEDVEYFGVYGNTSENARNQVDVIYYESGDDFAVSIETKTGDRVVFCKNPEGNTFNQIWNNMNQKGENRKDTKYLRDDDEFKAPNINFDESREYKELEGKTFLDADKNNCIIEKAVQTIKFKLGEKGGEIKSESGMEMMKCGAYAQAILEPRYFYVDDTFALFLVEDGKDVPYFAARIEDITKFQD